MVGWWFGVVSGWWFGAARSVVVGLWPTEMTRIGPNDTSDGPVGANVAASIAAIARRTAAATSSGTGIDSSVWTAQGAIWAGVAGAMLVIGVIVGRATGDVSEARLLDDGRRGRKGSNGFIDASAARTGSEMGASAGVSAGTFACVDPFIGRNVA